jgi:transcriptional regulator with XRE-family HTH domain
MKSGMDQQELSGKLGESHNFVHRVESGDRGIDLVRVVRFLDATGADRMQFFKDLLTAMDRISKGDPPRKP